MAHEEKKAPVHVVVASPDVPVKSDIERLADALIARGPKDPMEILGMSPEQQRALTARTPPKRFRILAGLSPDSGARMGLFVVEEPNKKLYPHGKVVNFRGYRYPNDLLEPVDQGGRLPTGFRVYQDGRSTHGIAPNAMDNQGLKIQFKEWRRKGFYTEDHRSIIGRPLRVAYLDPDGKGLDVPWETPSSEAAEDAAE